MFEQAIAVSISSATSRQDESTTKSVAVGPVVWHEFRARLTLSIFTRVSTPRSEHANDPSPRQSHPDCVLKLRDEIGSNPNKDRDPVVLSLADSESLGSSREGCNAQATSLGAKTRLFVLSKQ